MTYNSENTFNLEEQDFFQSDFEDDTDMKILGESDDFEVSLPDEGAVSDESDECDEDDEDSEDIPLINKIGGWFKNFIYVISHPTVPVEEEDDEIDEEDEIAGGVLPEIAEETERRTERRADRRRTERRLMENSDEYQPEKRRSERRADVKSENSDKRQTAASSPKNRDNSARNDNSQKRGGGIMKDDNPRYKVKETVSFKTVTPKNLDEFKDFMDEFAKTSSIYQFNLDRLTKQERNRAELIIEAFTVGSVGESLDYGVYQHHTDKTFAFVLARTDILQKINKPSNPPKGTPEPLNPSLTHFTFINNCTNKGAFQADVLQCIKERRLILVNVSPIEDIDYKVEIKLIIEALVSRTQRNITYTTYYTDHPENKGDENYNFVLIAPDDMEVIGARTVKNSKRNIDIAELFGT